MILSIVGDVLGSSIEFNPTKPDIRDINLATMALRGRPTDDSILTLATWDWWLDFTIGKAGISDYLQYLNTFFCLSPDIGYGDRFYTLMTTGKMTGSSCGNGAAMRISPLGTSGINESALLDIVEKITVQTHTHPAAIIGAQAVVIAMRRRGEGVDGVSIMKEIESRFGYNLLNLDYSELLMRPFNATCQGSVPQAIWCALTSDTPWSMFKKALSIGGDSDTIACIAGGIYQMGHHIDFCTSLPAVIAMAKAYGIGGKIREALIRSVFAGGFSGQLIS